MIPAAGQCVWGCGSNQPFNREHIIAKQIAKALGMPFPVPMSWGDIRRSTGRQIEHGERLENELAITLDDRVCQRCNGQWMKKSDDRMLKFTLRNADRVQLDAKQQAVLALWANKVGLLLALWLHDQPLTDPEITGVGKSYAPADNFLALFKRQKPPDRTRIWIGAVADTAAVREVGVRASQIRASREGTAPVSCGYYTLFHLKRLVFFVSGWDIEWSDEILDWPNPERVLPDSRAMRRISPLRERVVEWPPPARLEADDLNKLISGQPTGIQPASG